MKHPNRTIRLLSLLFIAAPSQTGCTDTIEAFPREKGEGGSEVDSEGEGAAPASPIQGEPVSLADAAAGGDADAGTCTLKPGARVLSPCRRAYQACAISGPAFAEATFIGCSDEQGIGGNPLLTVDTCEQALLGESGQTCSDQLSCMAASDDTCCVRRATCDKDAKLMLAEVCVASCERTALLPGQTVHNCTEVAAVAVEPESRYGSPSKLPNLVGLPCVGEFQCGPESSYGFTVFCGAGRLQLLTLGSGGF
jgi:hypothetical protein